MRNRLLNAVHSIETSHYKLHQLLKIRENKLIMPYLKCLLGIIWLDYRLNLILGWLLLKSNKK